ncbi:MAG: hypothetical protein NTX49_04805 [Chlamydiae bacterium]|nr:hypothetical protein [Chlamydiota bacterium]
MATASIMASAVCPTSLPITKEIPSWQLPVAAGRITLIRTLETSEFKETLRLLQIWKNTYTRLPKGSSGEYVASHCFGRLSTGKVLLAEDSKGIVQAIGRVTTSIESLYLEELVVAPWNNASCREFTSSEAWSLEDEGLQELALKYTVSIEGLTAPNKGSGTIMMYALCKLAINMGEGRLTVTSVEDSTPFYQILGMEPGDSLHSYSFDLSRGVPTSLLSKAGDYLGKD